MYSDRLLGMIDKCLSPETDERPQSIRECSVLLQADQDERFRHLVNDIALKMAAHFCFSPSSSGDVRCIPLGTAGPTRTPPSNP